MKKAVGGEGKRTHSVKVRRRLRQRTYTTAAPIHSPMAMLRQCILRIPTGAQDPSCVETDSIIETLISKKGLGNSAVESNTCAYGVCFTTGKICGIICANLWTSALSLDKGRPTHACRQFLAKS